MGRNTVDTEEKWYQFVKLDSGKNMALRLCFPVTSETLPGSGGI